ncbi:MAG: FAD-dependent oxidoreductase, partial [Ilumatobacter sp.]|nr:FAD-dependent oxidoreductase [Ilumatobacter sp.]
MIGGGLAGLVAAVTAARQGGTVVLLDSRGFGGRGRSAERDGFTLNEGGHALYRGGGGWSVLESLGVHPQGVTPDASNYCVLWHGQVAPLPTTAKGIMTTRLLGVRSKMKLAGWFNDMAGTAAKAGDVSLDEWMAAEGARDDLRTYLTAMSRLVTYAARPGDMPAVAVLGQFALDGGVAYLHGGWQSIVDDLAARAVEAGVELADHQTVTGISSDGSGWTVATPDRTIDTSSVVIAAGGPQVAINLIGDDPAGWVERAGPAQRASCLDVGGRRGTVDFLQGTDTPMYLSAHAPAARLAPDG